MAKRKNHSPIFKSKVALEALKEEMTLAELASKHGIHPTLVTKWKKQAVEGMSNLFSGAIKSVEKGHETEIHALHAKIGQLAVENDFLKRAFGR